MHLVMFDIDGTLTESCDFDAKCYREAVRQVTGHELSIDWNQYKHATDSGVLDQFISMNGMEDDRQQVHGQVREKFRCLISDHLSCRPAKEINGAGEFLTYLRSRPDVEIAIATGGWEETAKLKLRSAGLDISGLPFASGSDHFDRVSIMQLAESRCRTRTFFSKTYFGDGLWDKRACHALFYNFILVGNALSHDKQVGDFTALGSVLPLIGLSPGIASKKE